MPVTIIGALEAIGKILGLVALFKGPGKIGNEAEVAAVIQAVQDQVGLTEDVKWAWACYDRRYPELGLGNTWKSYCHYAGHHIQFWEDPSHWKKCAERMLERIQYHLNKAVQIGPPPPVGALSAFLDKLKKSAPYMALGGGIFLAAILVWKASK